VSVIDTATDTVVATIPVGGAPWGVAVTPDGSTVYVADNSDVTVSVIATATNTVVGSPISVGTFPFGLAVSSSVHSRKCATHPFRYRLSSFMQAVSDCPQFGGVISRTVVLSRRSAFADSRTAVCQPSAVCRH
jgi:YVTN family beta-propeller protein